MQNQNGGKLSASVAVRAGINIKCMNVHQVAIFNRRLIMAATTPCTIAHSNRLSFCSEITMISSKIATKEKTCMSNAINAGDCLIEVSYNINLPNTLK